MEPTATPPTDDDVGGQHPDMFTMTTGAPCSQIINSAQNGMNEDVRYKFISAYDADGLAGEASDGWWVVNGGLKTSTTRLRQRRLHVLPGSGWHGKDGRRSLGFTQQAIAKGWDRGQLDGGLNLERSWPCGPSFDYSCCRLNVNGRQRHPGSTDISVARGGNAWADGIHTASASDPTAWDWCDFAPIA
jgi:hypothetical protein